MSDLAYAECLVDRMTDPDSQEPRHSNFIGDSPSYRISELEDENASLREQVEGLSTRLHEALEILEAAVLLEAETVGEEVLAATCRIQ